MGNRASSLRLSETVFSRPWSVPGQTKDSPMRPFDGTHWSKGSDPRMFPSEVHVMAFINLIKEANKLEINHLNARKHLSSSSSCQSLCQRCLHERKDKSSADLFLSTAQSFSKPNRLLSEGGYKK